MLISIVVTVSSCLVWDRDIEFSATICMNDFMTAKNCCIERGLRLFISILMIVILILTIALTVLLHRARPAVREPATYRGCLFQR